MSYLQVNLIFEGYNGYSNFENYMVDGTQHCYTNQPVVYTSDTTGTSSRSLFICAIKARAGTQGGKVEGETTMVEWIDLMPLAEDAQISTECYGKDLEEVDWTGTLYCDAELQGKVFG
jgi:hypothetical protein